MGGLDLDTLDELWSDHGESWGPFALAEGASLTLDRGADDDPLMMSDLELRVAATLQVEEGLEGLAIHQGETTLLDRDGLLAVQLAGGEGFILDHSHPGRLLYDCLDLDRVGDLDLEADEPDRVVAVGERVRLGSCSGATPGLTWAWAQTAGPPVELAGAETASVAFTVPPTAAGAELAFEVVLAGATGVSVHTHRVRVEG